MFDSLQRAALTAAVLTLTFSLPASGQTASTVGLKPVPPAGAKRPAITTRCLAPGSGRPVACAAAQPGAELELLATGALADAPRTLVLRQVGGPHRATLQPKWFIDHAMTVKARMPATRQLCPAGAKGQQLQFEIQMATSDMNQARSGDGDSVGFFQMRC